MTFKPTQAQLDAALLHAEMVQPRESCGVIADGEYIPMSNIAQESDTFVLDMKAYRKISSEHVVEAVVHSHVNLPPIASDADRSVCEATALPWLILSWPSKTWSVIRPCGYKAPLVGRQWAWGSLDCYGLIRDAFQSYTGILIPDYDREWKFWKNGQNLIEEHFVEAGFVSMPQGTEPQHCDAFGMRIDSPVINHLGLYIIDPERGGVLLHQLQDRLSVREIYGGLYIKATELHLRHQNFLERPPA